MTIVYAVINNKGGTGKTTTAVTLADLTARANQDVPVCLVDLDPQGHAATFLGLDQEVNGRCIGKVLKDRSTLRANIINGSAPDRERPNLFVMPSSRDLDVSLEELVALATVAARRGGGPNLNTILADVLAPLSPKFGYIFIDCPPNLGVLTTAVYNFADFAIVPSATRFADFQGAQEHTAHLAHLRQAVPDVKAKLKVVVPTMYDQRRTQDKRVLAEMETIYGRSTVTEAVPLRVETQEAPESGMTLFEYSRATGKSSQALAVYARIAKRILN
jgi:chromosome partitioning protein